MPVEVIEVNGITATVQNLVIAGPTTVEVILQGAQGVAGAMGPGNLFVQPTVPVNPPVRHLWVQTGLGNSGKDFTFWIEDGT